MVQKGMYMAAIIALLLIVGWNSYAESPDFIKSPQREATADQLWSDSDFFMDPRGYVNLEFNNLLAVVALQGNHADFNNTRMAQFGFGARLPGLYAGLYFAGNTWKLQDHNYLEMSEPAETFFHSAKTIRRYGSLPVYLAGASRPRNEISVLIGAADMGFRLSYVTTLWSRKLNEDFKVTSTTPNSYYKSFQAERGSINPELAWGMTQDLITGWGIKPYVSVDVDFGRNYLRYEQYTTADTTAGEYINNSENYIKVGLTAKMGAFTLISQDGADFGFDLWYTLGLTMYDNEYNYKDAAGMYQVGNNLKGTYNIRSTVDENGDTVDIRDIAEKSDMDHTVTPYVFASWSGEKLSLGAELGLELGFGGGKNTSLILKDDYTDALVKNGMDTARSYFAFNPVLSVGMQWEIVARKFFLNAGGSVGFGGFTFTTTESAEYVQDIKADHLDVKAIDHSFTPASTTLSAGVGFNPTENLGLQAMCGVGAGNVINVFSTGNGLVVFSRILILSKF